MSDAASVPDGASLRGTSNYNGELPEEAAVVESPTTITVQARSREDRGNNQLDSSSEEDEEDLYGVPPPSTVLSK
jgi:hypothetical protein